LHIKDTWYTLPKQLPPEAVNKVMMCGEAQYLVALYNEEKQTFRCEKYDLSSVIPRLDKYWNKSADHPKLLQQESKSINVPLTPSKPLTAHENNDSDSDENDLIHAFN
jgi:hypothetical protein